jgi:hypothetical protein
MVDIPPPGESPRQLAFLAAIVEFSNDALALVKLPPQIKP